jgi:hypothetical protein
VSSRVYDASSDGDCNHIIHSCPHLRTMLMTSGDTRKLKRRTKLNLTRLSTFLERSLKTSKLLRFDDTRMNEALDIATSPECVSVCVVK